MEKVMSRADIENIEVGQLGLYQWDKNLPVCRVGELREVLVGPKKGNAFRYIEVKSASGNATIGFCIQEGD